MKITQKPFGRTAGGAAITAYLLESEDGSGVELLDYGCTIRRLFVPDREGRLIDVCLGYDTIEEYEKNDGYLGAVVGRHANRIANGLLDIGGRRYQLACNNGPNHLHGGVRGFDRCVWIAQPGDDGIAFSRLSPAGEEGYPGNLQVRVSYSWSDEHALIIRYAARTDADTALNLTNHCYFNLAGGGSILAQLLRVDAERFLENDGNCLPTGQVLPCAEHPAMDFRAAKPIGRDIGADDFNLRNGRGYDHNYILTAQPLRESAARLLCPDNGIRMEVFTDQPGLQVYSANFLTARAGKNGALYRERYAVCLETQRFPNSLACGFRPSALLRAGESFESQTVYRFGTVGAK